MPGAFGTEGIVGAMSAEAATSVAVFHACLEKALLPELGRIKPDAVLIMDSLPAHEAPAVRAVLDAPGFPYRYLPFYSPDLNPIEPAWAKVKAGLRRAAARMADALHEAPGPALVSVTARDATGVSSAIAATAVPAEAQNALAGIVVAESSASSALIATAAWTSLCVSTPTMTSMGVVVVITANVSRPKERA